MQGKRRRVSDRVDETSNIVKTSEGAGVDNEGTLTPIDAESYVSMNMWGLTPEFMQTLKMALKSSLRIWETKIS